MYKKSIVIVLIGGLILACNKEETPKKYNCATTPTYTADIKPIFDTNCSLSGCHNNASKEAGVDLSSFVGSKAAAANQSLMGAIQHLSGYEKMPQGSSKLPEATIEMIGCWVQGGTPE